jgi:hypothetical protein
MATTARSLWPESVKIDTLTPVVILRGQASELERITKGVLRAEVTSLPTPDGFLIHQLDVIAPAVAYYRHRILEVKHPEKFVYPAMIFAQGTGIGEYGIGREEAESQEEFENCIERVLQSAATLSVIHSLIAQSNELTYTPPAPPEPLESPG